MTRVIIMQNLTFLTNEQLCQFCNNEIDLDELNSRMESDKVYYASMQYNSNLFKYISGLGWVNEKEWSLLVSADSNYICNTSELLS